MPYLTIDQSKQEHDSQLTVSELSLSFWQGSQSYEQTFFQYVIRMIILSSGL